MYDKELPLSRLRTAQAAIERKINFCYGVQPSGLNLKPVTGQSKKMMLQPTYILVCCVRIIKIFTNKHCITYFVLKIRIISTNFVVASLN